jgi:pimeloyl-ACP methyl ester carboxylesterase
MKAWRSRVIALQCIVAVLGVLGLTGGTAVAGASTSTTTPSTQVVSVAEVIDAPVQVAGTAEGAVAYRQVGSGGPILLIMGLGGSMDDWSPTFVAGLAAHHQVTMFDNAGVGQTAAVPAPLSIAEMANQTSALLSTLGLGRVAVLGWSMGGMVAQSLAVQHPNQVSKIMLAATQPGTGHAVPIPAAAAAKAASGNAVEVLSVLFPPTAVAATQAYVRGVIRYPNRYTATSTIVAEQATAVGQWMAGDDPAGNQFHSVRRPLLVADGSEDALDPSANDRSLAHSVRGAKLILYPGAGHGFLFQDTASFVPAVERFLQAH